MPSLDKKRTQATVIANCGSFEQLSQQHVVARLEVQIFVELNKQ